MFSLYSVFFDNIVFRLGVYANEIMPLIYTFSFLSTDFSVLYRCTDGKTCSSTILGRQKLRNEFQDVHEILHLWLGHKAFIFTNENEKFA